MRPRTLGGPLRMLGGLLLLLLVLSCPSLLALAQVPVAAPPTAASHAARPAAPRPTLRRHVPYRHGFRFKRRVPYRHRFASRRAPLRRRAIHTAVVTAPARKSATIIIPGAPPLPSVPAPALPGLSPAAPSDAAPAAPPPSDAPPAAPAPTVKRHAPAKRRVAKRPAPKPVSLSSRPPAKPLRAPVGAWIKLNAHLIGALGESTWVNLSQAGNIRFYRTGKTSFAAVGIGGSYVSTSNPAEIQQLRGYVLSHRMR